MSLMTLQDCGHGRDYTMGDEVRSAPFAGLPFTFRFATCNLCQQSEILPDLVDWEELEDYDDWRLGQIDFIDREYSDPQWNGTAQGY